MFKYIITGRCHDHLGNYNNWWKSETWKQYKKKGECFVKAYNRYNTTLEGITKKASYIKIYYIIYIGIYRVYKIYSNSI